MRYKITEVTPIELQCGIGACPSIYEVTSKPVYLIRGKVVNPSEAGFGGLEGKIGEGEALIEVPRALIDNRKK